ncbi:MucBP domain-containing protein [Fructilactobacillus hinvesii]|uniref:MucBP domain-containing protein n=1 Tax=Fructilactobacillus hinvesii TaxID=2940300 RepID=A0ABY5BRS0_9LACO|nr:MucBP domain-containing protein [Fructilactobacillus hinvesii]USS87818.1 MucBP domain-containing protein [Fructilactobacillus hinvesii]
MKKQKIFLTGLAALTFGTVGIATLPLHPVSVQAQSTSDSSTQGEIVVHYVDQSGNVLRSATVATGKAGTVYYAPIPNIKGYTYSRVENGQNDSYGAAMIFGGNDTGTGVQEMSIVYAPSNPPAQSGSQITGSSATGNQTGTATGQSAGNTSQQTTSSAGQSSDATNQTAMSQQAQTDQTGTHDQQSSSKPTKSKQKAKSQQPKKQEKKKATKKATKKTDQKSDQQKKKQPKHHSIVPWIVGGVILVAIVVGAGLWNHRYEPRH